MKLRTVRFSCLDTPNVLRALSTMDYNVTLIRGDSIANSWLASNTIVDRITDTLSESCTQRAQPLTLGQAWKLLPPDTWEAVAAVTDNFQWDDPSPHDLDVAIPFATNVMAGTDSLEDVFAHPIIFLATLTRESVRGPRVAIFLQAIFLVSLVLRNGGEMVWNRYAPAEDADFPNVNVSWRDGTYFLTDSHWSRFKSWRNTKSKRGPARLLRGSIPDPSPALTTEQSSGWSYVETRDVAEAALWLGVTVREVRVNALRRLLQPGTKEERIRYVESVGVDLADLLALGWKTAIHLRHGRVVTFDETSLLWPSLREIGVRGYTFVCDWGLGRDVEQKEQCKQRYHYIRGHYNSDEEDWEFLGNCETYVSQTSTLRRLFSLARFAVFWARHRVLGKEFRRVNVREAQSRAKRTVEFLESREETAVEPQVSPTMLKALSNRIAVNLRDAAIESAFDKCFGETGPSGSLILDDELVVVLSYRHASVQVRMHRADWRRCYSDLSQVAAAHGKAAMRVWTDHLASLSRGDAGWVESGVEPYRNAVVVAFNGSGDSVFVDRFWLSLERNTGLRAWGYWVRDDLGQIVRLGTTAYPARTEDRAFLAQILFTPGRADGALWEEDRLAVVREAGERLGVLDVDSLWDALTWEFLRKKYVNFAVVNQKREAGLRKMKERGWSAATDVLVDRELLEKAFGFAVVDLLRFEVRKWMYGEGGGNRLVAVKSLVSEHWFCAKVVVGRRDGRWCVEDVLEREVLQTEFLDECVAEMELDVCEEEWD